MRVAINGFGRIGRAVMRAGWSRVGIDVVHVNDVAPVEMLGYLLARDSVHGTWPHDVAVVDGGLAIDGVHVPFTAERDPARLPWRHADVDLVLECTGHFTTRDLAATHLEAGARRVLVSAPARGADATFVYGVNHETFDPARHHVVSNASCTTNCLAPVAKVLHEAFGLEHGFMSTVHSYTMDQNLLDAPHRHGNLRRARAAAVNIVPTTTGAAKAVGLVIPELDGRLDGIAIRVPTPDGSLVDLVATVGRDTSIAEVNAALQEAADGRMKGVLVVEHAPVVSRDILGNPASSIVDAPSTNVIGKRMVKVMSWYDNEWGFSNRLLDLAALVGGGR
jgi:glyceraldehyde 3-phosphate dehydrogenase